jgi:hypothetical protein
MRFRNSRRNAFVFDPKGDFLNEQLARLMTTLVTDGRPTRDEAEIFAKKLDGVTQEQLAGRPRVAWDAETGPKSLGLRPTLPPSRRRVSLMPVGKA